VFVVAGHADDCVTVYLGYGLARRRATRHGAGFNAERDRTSDALWKAGASKSYAPASAIRLRARSTTT